MPASEAAAERVFSAQPVVQETESASTDLKDEAYGGLLLKATPPKKSVSSPGLLDNAKAGDAQQWSSTCLISRGHDVLDCPKGGNPDLMRSRRVFGHGQRSRAGLRPAPVISPKKVSEFTSEFRVLFR